MADPIQLNPAQMQEATANAAPQPVQLSPEQLQEAQANAAPQAKDIFQTGNSKDIFDFAKQNPDKIDLPAIVASRPDLQKDPATLQKISDAYTDLIKQPLLASITEHPGRSLWTMTKNLAQMPVGFAAQLTNMAGAAAGAAGLAASKLGIPGFISDDPNLSPEDRAAATKEAQDHLTRSVQQRVANLGAATEVGLGGLANMGQTAVKKLFGKSLDQYTDQDKIENFLAAVEKRKQAQDAIQGHGPLMQTLGQHVIADLEKQGQGVQPEKVEKLAQFDPFSMQAFAAPLEGAGALAKATGAAQLTQQALQSAGKGLAKVAVPVISKPAGLAAEGIGFGIKKSPGLAESAGTGLGAHVGGTPGALIGEQLGKVAGKGLSYIAEPAGQSLQDIGKAIRSGGSQIVKDVAEAAPTAAAQLGGGLALDVGTQALGAETPQEKENITPYGTFFGALASGRTLSKRVLSGQIVGAKDWGSDVALPSTGNFPDLASVHQSGVQQSSAAPGVARRVNASRQLLQGIDPNAEFFYAPHPAEGEADTLPAALKAAGIPEDRANSGGFTTTAIGTDGKPHTVVVARDIDAAPHEGVHALDNVIGAGAVQELNAAAKQEYGGVWDQLTQHYATLLNDNNPVADPVSYLLDRSGKGNQFALEKLVNDAVSQEMQRSASGKLTDSQVKDISDVVKQNNPTVDWRKVLSPDEQQYVADQYIGNEVRAENGDAWFKAGQDPKTFRGKMAMAAAKAVQALGGNPLEGRTSEILGLPLSLSIIKGVSGAFKGRPIVTPTAKPIFPKITAAPGSPERQQQEETRQNAVAASAPDIKLPGQIKSQQEMMGVLNEARATGGTVDVQYGHAGGTAPAAGADPLSSETALDQIFGNVSRPIRRSFIEAWRQMPIAARQFASKYFSPEQFFVTKQGKFQAYGGVHAVLAANAQKLANFKVQHPEFKLPTGWEVDSANNTWTPDTWNKIFQRVDDYSHNQLSGRTGAGGELVVPTGMKETFAPPVKGEARPIPQDEADVINALYGVQIPKTAKISKGDVLPLNIRGQRISAATLPGRVEPKGAQPEFTGERAQQMGIEGERVLSVNPFQTALKGYKDAPSFIEARQRLNLEHMADVNPAPAGAPALRANTLTQAAGFAPRSAQFSPMQGGEDDIIKTSRRFWVTKDGETRPAWGSHAWQAMQDHLKGWTPPKEKELEAEAANDEMLRRGNVRGVFHRNPDLLNLNGSKWSDLSTATQSEIRRLSQSLNIPVDFNGRPIDTGVRPIEGLDSAQFAPSSEPRAIKMAAVRDEDSGKVYEGPMHASATLDYLKEKNAHQLDEDGNLPPEVELDAWNSHKNLSEGFTTNEGEFLDRQEAFDRAQEMKQYVARPSDDQSLESTAFERQQELARRGYPLQEVAAAFAPKRVWYGRDVDSERDRVSEKLYGKPYYGLVSPDLQNGVNDALGIPREFDEISPRINNQGATVPPTEAAFAPLKPKGSSTELLDEIHKAGFVGAFTENPDYWNVFRKESGDPNQLWIMQRGDMLFGNNDRKWHFVPLSTEDARQIGGVGGEFSQFSPKKTFIVRHGSTEMNNADPDKDLIRGHINVPLDTKGKQEAIESGKQIASQGGVQHIVHSDLDRTTQTAEAIQKENPGATLESDPRLRPWNFGPTIEGKPTSKMLPRIKKLTENPDERPPGGETFNEFKDRFLEGFHDAQNNHADKNTAIVTHYRGTKLLDAWRATGTDNDTIDKAVFENYDRDKKPGNVDVVDKTGAEIKRLESSQFAPSKNPRAIKTAAIRSDKDNEIFTGKTHAIALDKATDAGYVSAYIPLEEQGLIEGFLDNSGKFLTREAAYKRAIEEKQFTEEAHDQAREDVGIPPELMTEPQLEALSFNKLKQGQFAPKKPVTGGRKSKQDYELKESPGSIFSRAWILPDGKPVQLGSQMHHDWLNENPDITKKYGLKTTTSDEENRVDALKKGFARVHYEKNTGTLKVEARAQDWPKLSPSVKQLAETNLRKIDNMDVHLLDPTAKKIVDQDGVALHTYDADEKMDHLPLISEPTSTVTMSAQAPAESAQFAPKFSSPDLDNELDKIRKGESIGQTFNPDGTVWTPEDKKSDIVTLASVNLPAGQLNRAALEKAAAPYEDLLDEPNVKLGAFSFSHQGTPTVSIDINAVVPKKYRDNSVKFAKDNDQVAIYDAEKNDVVETGGKGNTKLKSIGELSDALQPLTEGEPVNVDEIIRQNREAEPETEQGFFPGIGTKEPLSTAALSNMTKAQIAAHFPEAVQPKTRKQQIESNIVGSPLAKEAGVKGFAQKLVDFAKEYKDYPIYQEGLKWYSDFVPKLKSMFGKNAPMMAELLAATSPRNNPTINYAYALDALEGNKAGRYTKQSEKFMEGLEMLKDDSWKKWYSKEAKAGRLVKPQEEPTQENFVAQWITRHNLKPRQSNGQLFGANSTAVLRVLAGQWLNSVEGPKVSNFVQNLLGTGHGATIDVWANRTMRRIGYSGYKDRWRILPMNEAAVTDEDFAFSQKAFAEAAEQLGVKPDALQGALWFSEKKLWNDRGYAKLDLGSYIKEMEKTPMLKQGIQQRLAAMKKAAKAKPIEQPTLL